MCSNGRRVTGYQKKVSSPWWVRFNEANFQRSNVVLFYSVLKTIPAEGRSRCCDVWGNGSDEGSDTLAFVSVTFTGETLISIRPTRDPFNLSEKDVVTYSLSDWDCHLATGQEIKLNAWPTPPANIWKEGRTLHTFILAFLFFDFAENETCSCFNIAEAALVLQGIWEQKLHFLSLPNKLTYNLYRHCQKVNFIVGKKSMLNWSERCGFIYCCIWNTSGLKNSLFQWFSHSSTPTSPLFLLLFW